MIKFIKASFTLLLYVFLCACSSITPHENFELHMSKTIGKSSNQSNSWMRDDRLIRVRKLPNGNTEKEYTLNEYCRYFFEIDKDSKLVVDWRFEGREIDCEINP